MTIWVGNLPEAVSELDIRSFFRNVNVMSWPLCFGVFFADEDFIL